MPSDKPEANFGENPSAQEETRGGLEDFRRKHQEKWDLGIKIAKEGVKFWRDFGAHFGESASDIWNILSEKNTAYSNTKEYLEAGTGGQGRFNIEDFSKKFLADNGVISLTEGQIGYVFKIGRLTKEFACQTVRPLKRAGEEIILNPSLAGLWDGAQVYLVNSAPLIVIGGAGGALLDGKKGLLIGALKGAAAPVFIPLKAMEGAIKSVRIAKNPMEWAKITALQAKDVLVRQRPMLPLKTLRQFETTYQNLFQEMLYWQQGLDDKELGLLAKRKIAQVRKSMEKLMTDVEKFGLPGGQTVREWAEAQEMKVYGKIGTKEAYLAKPAEEILRKSANKEVRALARALEEATANLASLAGGGNRTVLSRAMKQYTEAQAGLVESLKKLPVSVLESLDLGKMGKIAIRGGTAVFITIEAARIIKFIKMGDHGGALHVAAEISKDLCPVWGSARDTKRAYESFRQGEIKQGFLNSGFAALGWTSDALIAGGIFSFGLSTAGGVWLRGATTAMKMGKIARAMEVGAKLGESGTVATTAALTATGNLTLGGAALIDSLWENTEKTEIALGSQKY